MTGRRAAGRPDAGGPPDEPWPFSGFVEPVPGTTRPLLPTTEPLRAATDRLPAATEPVPQQAGWNGHRPASRPVVDLRGVTKTYGSGDTVVHAVAGVDLVIERGDYVAVMGASGSGKSTLMNIVGCLDVPSRGRYRLDGVDTRRLDERRQAMVRNRKIGFVFQSFNLIARTSALANVELPLAYAGVRGAERRERAVAALERVGLGDRLGHVPAQLSGGQQQRVAIARAIVTEPVLLLADEPTGALDSHSTAEVLALFDELNAGGRTLVVITHEEEVAAHAKRVLRMRDGLIRSDQRACGVADPPPRLAEALRLRPDAGPGQLSGAGPVAGAGAPA